jgi:hypothetical protein
MTQPRKHHYVPKFLLAGFTRQGTATGDLHVFDKKRGILRASTPNNEAHKRDHYRVEADDPFIIEKTVGSTLEDRAAPVIATIVRKQVLPSDLESRGILLSLVASLATRVRSERDHAQEHFAKVAAMYENIVGSSYDTYRAAMQAAGAESVTQADYDEWRAYLRSEHRPRWHRDQTSLVLQELSLAARIFPYFWARKWCLGTSEQLGVEFVVNDRPVLLVDSQQNGFIGPALAGPHTSVIIPLWRRAVLIGTWNAQTNRLNLSRSEVADINTICIHQAYEYVWSPRPRFAFRGVGGQLLRDPQRLLDAGLERADKRVEELT